MEFSIARESLLKPLQIVGGVVEKRQTMPVLANVLVTVDEKGLTLAGTDLEVELLARAEVEAKAPGEITIPARKFMDICRTLPDAAVLAVKTDGDKVLLRSGRSRFALSTMPASEFPSMEGLTGSFKFTLARKALKKLIDQTQFSMANQDVRYYLNGMLLEVEGNQLRAVATDGHRLAICELGAEIGDDEPRQVIIPRKAVMELGRLVGDDDETCEIEINSTSIRVVVGDVTMTSKLIDGKFPDYNRVVPASAGFSIQADTDALRQALVRTSILSREKYRGIRLHFEPGMLRATVNNPEHEEAEEELEVEFGGDTFEIGFNVSYLLDALNAIKEEKVELQMTDANSSCLIRGLGNSESRYVVMPMRL